MSLSEKKYVVIQNGSVAIDVTVIRVDDWWSAVMVLAPSRDDLRPLFGGRTSRHETGITIEATIAACNKWVKENLCSNAELVETDQK